LRHSVEVFQCDENVTQIVCFCKTILKRGLHLMWVITIDDLPPQTNDGCQLHSTNNEGVSYVSSHISLVVTTIAKIHHVHWVPRPANRPYLFHGWMA